MATLAQLAVDGVDVPPGTGAVEISGLTADSRAVTPGMLFAAIPGTRVDGARFVPQAIAAGAAAVLCAADAAIDATVPVLRARNPRRALALMAARFYARQPANIAAVTGTAGKTSVADFARQIFTALGYQAASLGTIGLVRPDGSVYGGLTTPDPVTLQATLAELAGEGVTHLAFEASSHGLDQHRLDGVRVSAAAFTNLGRDHMDYHPTVEHYLNAKLRLFRELLIDGGTAVVNMDGAYSEAARRAAVGAGHRVVTVGQRGETIKLISAGHIGFRQRLTLEAGGRTKVVDLPLIGAYQVENALTAAGLCQVFGDLDAVLRALEHLSGVPGRLEIVGEANGALVVVDYAHKPEALSAALAAVRPFATGRVICLIGCGGDRDPGKRPIMGKIANDHSNLAIITDDNPRTEDPAAIRQAMLAAAPDAIEIGDRAEAIDHAVRIARTGDVVLIAGKGHETGQTIGERILPFSDQAQARAAIARSVN